MGPVLLRKYQRYDFQKGDWWELQNVSFGQAEDGTETVKLYLTMMNKRTGDQHIFTTDDCLFEPEGLSEDTVDRLSSQLGDSGDDPKEWAKTNKKAVALLKKARLIEEDYKPEDT